MLRIGITGGIGSGKSVVARIFETLGIPVYYADKEAKRLMNEDAGLRKQIIAGFGELAYSNGVLNRQWLASAVFNDPDKLLLLNSLVHPATILDSDQWMRMQNTPYVLKEAALIFESEAHRHLDLVIGVTAPEALRISRTIQRDGITVEEVKLRMLSQMDEEMKMRLCQYVIINDEEQALLPQVLHIHEELVAVSSGKIKAMEN